MRSVLLILVLFNVACAFNNTTTEKPTRKPKKPLTTTKLIKKQGYSPKVYRALTDDGFILELTRLENFKEGVPVLMVHGLFGASDVWVQRGRKKDLAYILSDNGFDVWLADLRGNVYSKRHFELNSSLPEYWDYSFHEMGLHDIPKYINVIQIHTLYPKIFYIGYSMGTTSFFAMASMKPEFNNNIEKAIMLSPIAFGVDDMKSQILRQLINKSEEIHTIFNAAGKYNIFPRDGLVTALIGQSCKSFPKVCLNVLGDLLGENRSNLDMDKLGPYMSSSLSGASVKTVVHFAQIYKTGEFKQFDYGPKKNQRWYGQPKPPNYPLEKITAPIGLFYSHNDNLLDEAAVDKLSKILPNVFHKEALPNYSHFDYVFGNDANSVLYSTILRILKNNTLRHSTIHGFEKY